MSRYTLIIQIVVVQFLLVQAHAQTQIGGGVCTNATLKGIYGVTNTGRQLTSSGTLSKVFQGVGTVTFDGQSKATFALNISTNGGSIQQQSYSGSYNIAADCSGTLTANVSPGVTALYSLSSWNQNKNLAMSGSDGTYALLLSGVQQTIIPCAVSSLSGNYSFQLNGDQFAGGAVKAVFDASGIIQFDGQGNLTGASFGVANQAAGNVTLTGTYTVSPDCSGSATYKDSTGQAYTASVIVNGPEFAVTGVSSQIGFVGTGHATFLSGGQATTGTCTNASLSGGYGVSYVGRLASSSGTLTKVLDGSGTATFDGQGAVSLALNTTASGGPMQQQSYTGTYNIGSNCTGSVTLNIPGNLTAIYGVGVFNDGKNFEMSGADHTYAINVNGTQQPNTCVLSSLSGDYGYQANGWTFAGSSVAGAADFSGTFQFDGRGNLTGNSSQVANGKLTTVTQTGTYTVASNCSGSATFTDSTGKSYTLALGLTVNGSDFFMTGSGSAVTYAGAGHVAFGSATQAVTNGASFARGSAAPGSIFSVFGQGLASQPDSAGVVPLPTTLRTTSVTVNGEPAPLFFVSPGQINAQVPWDIQPGLATVVVKNGSALSDATAITVMQVAPGIFTYGNNRAVVQNPDNSVNSQSSPAHVGDVLVAYFTGGGQAQSPVATGLANPPSAVSVAQTNYSVTVSGKAATVSYMGLAPNFVGLYQTNFQVPQVASGDHGLIIAINGVGSLAPGPAPAITVR